jgi:hypothetical protein
MPLPMKMSICGRSNKMLPRFNLIELLEFILFELKGTQCQKLACIMGARDEIFWATFFLFYAKSLIRTQNFEDTSEDTLPLC